MADKARRLAEFQRACALNLATIHAPASAASAAGGSAAVDLELLETWLRENKLSLLFDNIKQRASSLDALVNLTEEELRQCAEEVDMRVALKTAVAKKRLELYPNYQAPRVTRWWCAAKVPKEYRGGAGGEEAVKKPKAITAATESSTQMPRALIMVRNLGSEATCRRLRQAMQKASNKRILDVYTYVAGAPAAWDDVAGESKDMSKLIAALAECYAKDVPHVLQSCHGLELDGLRLELNALELKRRAETEAKCKCPWQKYGCTCCTKVQATYHAQKIRSLLSLVKSEVAQAKADPRNKTSEARYKEAARKLHVLRYGVTRPGLDRPIPIPASGSGMRAPVKYAMKAAPSRPWREPVPKSHSPGRSKTGMYMGCYFFGSDVVQHSVHLRLPRRPWGVGEPQSVAHALLHKAHLECGKALARQRDALYMEEEEGEWGSKAGRMAKRRRTRASRVRGQPLPSKSGEAVYNRRLKKYLRAMEEEGVLDESNLHVALAIFHAGNCGLLQGLHLASKLQSAPQTVTAGATAPIGNVKDELSLQKSRPSSQQAARSEKREAASLGELMCGRKEQVLPQRARNYNPEALARLVELVEQVVGMTRVLNIAGEPVPKMLCDAALLRSVTVCPTAKGAKQALYACDSLSAVRKQVQKRVLAIRRGKPRVPQDRQSGVDGASSLDAGDSVDGARLAVVHEEEVKEGKVESATVAAAAQGVTAALLDVGMKERENSAEARATSRPERPTTAPGNHFEKWCSVWAKQRGPRPVDSSSRFQPMQTRTAPDSRGRTDYLQHTRPTSSVVVESTRGMSAAPGESSGGSRPASQHGAAHDLEAKTPVSHKPASHRPLPTGSLPACLRPAKKKSNTKDAAYRNVAGLSEASKEARIKELEQMLEEAGASGLPRAQKEELKELLKDRYKQQLWMAHTSAKRDTGKALAMSHVNMSWMLPNAMMNDLSRKTTPEVLKEATDLNKLSLALDVELSFEEHLPDIQQSLKSVLMLMASQGDFPRPKSDAKEDTAEAAKQDKRWLRIRNAVLGFTYQHPISGREKDVLDEDTYEEMLREFSRIAAQERGDLTRPSFLATPIIQASILA